MTEEDAMEFVEIAKTLGEHTCIIAQFEQSQKLDRDLALSKWDAFNKAHPDFYCPSLLIWSQQNVLVNLQDADNATIVRNLIQQLDWLQRKTIEKLSEPHNGREH